MIILFLLTAIFATTAVTIAAGLTVLLVYLWRKHMIALRAIQVLNNGYQTLRTEQTYTTHRDHPQEPAAEPLLFVAKHYNTIH